MDNNTNPALSDDDHELDRYLREVSRRAMDALASYTAGRERLAKRILELHADGEGERCRETA